MASILRAIPTASSTANDFTTTASTLTSSTTAPKASTPTDSTPTYSIATDSTPLTPILDASVQTLSAITPTETPPPLSSAKASLLPPRSCPDPTCSYSTPEGLFSEQLTDIQFHVRFSHPEPSTSSRTPQGLARPHVEENITQVDWRVFRDEWKRYRRSCLSQASNQDVIDQLKSCCSRALRRSIFSQNRLKVAFNNETDVENILKTIKEVAVTNIPKNVDDFLCMNQLPKENIENYATRLTSASLNCKFELPAGQTNYREQMVKHQLITGLADNKIRIQTIQTISNKDHVSLVEVLNVIKTKESASKEAIGSKTKIKGEYFEEPDTTQMDSMVKIETENNTSNSNDLLLQPQSPSASSVAMTASSANPITNKDDQYNKNPILPPPSPTPSTVSTIPFSPCQSREVSGNLVDKMKEENLELKGEICILDKKLAEKVAIVSEMQKKHEDEIEVLELQLELKSKAVEHMISVAQKDSEKHDTQINVLQEKERDCKIKLESLKKEILQAQKALNQMQEENTNAQNSLTDALAEKEELKATLHNNQKDQRQTQQEHSEEIKKLTTKLEQIADTEKTNLEENRKNIEERMCEFEEENRQLQSVNKNLKERKVPIQNCISPKRKIKDSVAENVTQKRGKFEEIPQFIKLKLFDEDGNELHFMVNKTTQLGKLKKSYSERVGVPVNSLRFLFDGRRIQDHETPNSLDIEHDDLIECYQD